MSEERPATPPDADSIAAQDGGTTVHVDETVATEAEHSSGVQQEMPFAIVEGQPITELPRDLYIPPDALRVFLQAFEGPLDLLLYLIRRQNLDILDIPIAEISRQYIQYIELMQELEFELVGEYLVMAAMLAEIKSRLLLPRPQTEGDEEEVDPRAELIRRLQEYERYKQAAEDLDALPRMERDYLPVHAEPGEHQVVKRLPEITLKELLISFREVLERAEKYSHFRVQLEPLSVRERMSEVLSRLRTDRLTDFASLFSPEEGRRGVAVTFLALLELLKGSLIELSQAEPFAPIQVRATGGDPDTITVSAVSE